MALAERPAPTLVLTTRVGTLRAGLAVVALLIMSACSGSDEPSLATSTFPISPIDFQDVTLQSQLAHQNSSCMIFDDVNGDSLPDLVLAPHAVEGTPDEITIHRNLGDGTFDTTRIELAEPGRAMSCTAGDLDADGHVDIVIGRAPAGLTVLMGHGVLKFSELAGAVPTPPADFTQLGMSAVGVFDFDRDGDLDIIGGRAGLPKPIRCASTGEDFRCDSRLPLDVTSTLLFRNVDGRSWEPVEVAPGSRQAASINGFGFIDIDRDGWLDVFINQDFATNGLYRNKEGTGEFEDITDGQGLSLYNHGMGNAFGDFDRNGAWDIYVTDLGPDQIWLGEEGGQMRNAALDLGVAEHTRYHSGWSPQARDFNQDGFLDIFVSNSALVLEEADLVSVGLGVPVAEPPRQADFIFTADQVGGYTMDLLMHIDSPDQNAAASGGVTAVADYDGDGDLDLAQFYNFPATFRLLRNDTENSGNWIHVELVPSDGYAYGAEVEARVGGRVLDRRVVHGSNGSIGKSWDVLHFGLGDFDQIDELVVWWPGREQQVFSGPFAANERHVLLQE